MVLNLNADFGMWTAIFKRASRDGERERIALPMYVRSPHKKNPFDFEATILSIIFIEELNT